MIHCNEKVKPNFDENFKSNENKLNSVSTSEQTDQVRLGDEVITNDCDATKVVEPPRLFCSLKGSISDRTMTAILKMGYRTMTEIQAKTIPKLLDGMDIKGIAKTGSGKTLAFLIPAVELMIKKQFLHSKGTGVIIVSPTRELAVQTYRVLSQLLEDNKVITFGLTMGGRNKNTEAKNLAEGMNIIVATPGRLLDHLIRTEFKMKHFCCLIIDEADRILHVGFEKEMVQILRLLPKKRQTMLFSATKNKKTNGLAVKALKSDVCEINVDGDKIEATVAGLNQNYLIVPQDKKFLLLYTFIKKIRKYKKAMVFFSSCKAVKYYDELFNHISMPVLCIHGLQKQGRRQSTFDDFISSKTGILLCTDVAARGWDIPGVDWIVQFDPPDNPREYIHRVGRTARAGSEGNAVLYIHEEQLGFIQSLKEEKVFVSENSIIWEKVAKEDVQKQLENLLSQNFELQSSAKAAFKSFIKAYVAYSSRIFDIQELDLKKIAKSFGLSDPPIFDIGSMISLKKRKKPFDHSTKSKRLKTSEN